MGRIIADLELPPDVVEFSMGLGFELVDSLQAGEHLVLVDAMQTEQGAPPGTVRVMELEEVEALASTPYCCHGMGLPEVFRLARRLAPERLPRRPVDGALPPSDVYAVDGVGSVFRYDGAKWTSSTKVSYPLAAVWGTAPTNVYVVGQYGYAARYDGKTWAPYKTGTYKKLGAVWGQGKTLMAAGEDGTIVHHDGAVWTMMSSDASASAQLHGVWGDGTGTVYTVGFSGSY